METALRVLAELNKLVRPYLTFFITTLYNVVLAWATFTGLLTVSDYMVAVGPINAMILGFWFAEKAALKDPRTGSDAKIKDE